MLFNTVFLLPVRPVNDQKNRHIMTGTLQIWFYALAAILLMINTTVTAQRDLTRYVDPLTGSMNSMELSAGNTYPCIALPFAMNHWTPQTAMNGERWQYSYTSHQITGLKETHQPSPWVGDYGVLSLMPTVGPPKFLEKDRQSWYSHQSEVALPGYYRVYLAAHDITAEMAPSERGCMMQFTYPETARANVVIDAFDQGSYIRVTPGKQKVEGYTTFHNGGKEDLPGNFKNYFIIIFDKPFDHFLTWADSSFTAGKKEANANRTGAVVTFNTRPGEKIVARVASSFISMEQAELNLSREIGRKSFAKVREEGTDAWNSYLSKFLVADSGINDLDHVRMFYTCLYRMLLYPRRFFEYDATGKIMHYSPYNGKVLPGRMYTDNGFWDTFRAEHPFFTLFFPDLSSHILEGLANTYRESGWLPEWASPGHINCMIGSNSASVIASAYLNGVKSADIDVLWNAVYKNAYHAHPSITSVGRAGIAEYDRLGYVPFDIINESAARTLEYAYDDFCVYRLAQNLHKDREIIETFRKRAMNYKNLFYDKYKLMAGKDSAGNFRPGFNPFAWGGDFTEGNSWHYTWSVLHDPRGLEKLMGGQKIFVQMLDTVFSMPPVFDDSYYGKVIHEIREMQIEGFGQYAHGNQPIQHMIYLYDWAGNPGRRSTGSRQVMDRLYHPSPDGYCGDEDNGQTSAWYVFSALGFYPVCPVTGEYAIGSPLFREVRITLPNGKLLELKADSNGEKSVYINGITIDGEPYSKNYFTRTLLQEGGTIDFQMSSKPNTGRGTQKADFPYSFSDEE